MAVPSVQARNILIATGARATVPAIPGAEHAIISDDILDLPQLPAKLAIIGGGYIALEFAGIYNNFGSETHVFYRQVCDLRLRLAGAGLLPKRCFSNTSIRVAMLGVKG